MTTTRPFSKWALLALLFAVLVVVDQWTKYLAVERLTVLFDQTGATTTAQRVQGFLEHSHLEPLATELRFIGSGSRSTCTRAARTSCR